MGHFATQLAQSGGARVTALVSGPHRVDTVRELGIDALRRPQVTGKVTLTLERS